MRSTRYPQDKSDFLCIFGDCFVKYVHIGFRLRRTDVPSLINWIRLITKTSLTFVRLFKEKKKKKKKNWIGVKRFVFVFTLCTNHVSLFISLVIISCHMTVSGFSFPELFFLLQDYLCIDVLYLKTMKSRVI